MEAGILGREGSKRRLYCDNMNSGEDLKPSTKDRWKSKGLQD